MSASESTRTWDDPQLCPFCGGALTSAGAGFIDHLGDSRTCEKRFDQWRGRVGTDIQGEWSG